MVTVNYRGTLIDGTEFDSSYKRGQPATFPVNGVIKGWTEALQLMKQGSKYQLFIPSTLAYGERAMGPDIGPNSTLIFEVELQDVKPPPTPAPTGFFEGSSSAVTGANQEVAAKALYRPRRSCARGSVNARRRVPRHRGTPRRRRIRLVGVPLLYAPTFG